MNTEDDIFSKWPTSVSMTDRPEIPASWCSIAAPPPWWPPWQISRFVVAVNWPAVANPTACALKLYCRTRNLNCRAKFSAKVTRVAWIGWSNGILQMCHSIEIRVYKYFHVPAELCQRAATLQLKMKTELAPR